MPRSSVRTLVFDRGGLIGIAALALYIAVAPHYVVDGDGAEMATAGEVGGVVHPTGYPAYLMWLRLTSWLPGGSPIHTAAISTAILGALGLVVLHAACRAWGARPLAASVTVAMFGAAPLVLRYNSEAEVFAMNNLVVATVLWLAAEQGPVHGIWRVALLGLVAGIGLSDHVTCALAGPVGIVGAVRGVREASTSKLAAIGAGIGALALGLTCYVYLLVTDETATSWGALHGFGDLVDHFLRRAYGGASSFSPHSGEVHVAANLVALAQTLGRSWLYLPCLAGLGAITMRIVKPSDGHRAEWIALAISFVLAGPVLATRFNLDPSGIDRYVVQRFHLLPTLLLAPGIAIALDRFGDEISRRTTIQLDTALSVATAIGFVLAAFVVLPRLQAVRSPAVDRALRTTLEQLPPNAVVFFSSDVQYLGSGYLQVAEQVRPDVVIVMWHFIGVRWFRERIERRGIPIDTQDGGKPSVRIAEAILASGRPLYVNHLLGNILTELPNYPIGTMFRVLPRGTPQPSLDDIADTNHAWFNALAIDYERPGPDDEYATGVHAGYATTWNILAEAYARAGRPAEARAASELGAQLGPQP